MTFSKAFAMTENPTAILTKSEKVEHLICADLTPKNCTARDGDLRCTLDASHRNLRTSHMHRNENGSFVFFREVQK
jgi:hypothetical protein